MSRYIRPLLGISLLLGTVLAGEADAQQGTVRLTVVEETGKPIPYAQGVLDRTRGVADAEGVLRFLRLAPGEYEVQVSHPGRVTRVVPVVVEEGRETAVRVVLSTTPVELPGVRVEAERAPRSPRLREFYARAREPKGGHFVTRKEIEKQRGAKFTDLLRRIPNVHFIRVQDGPISFGLYRIHLGRSLASVSDGLCPILYFLDGVEFPTGDNPDLVFRVPEIEGEVYPGAHVPAQFGGSRARCGAIAVWTREEG